jgi:predicted nucleotidyltransferase
MSQNTIITSLQQPQIKIQLNKYGIVHLWVFGSQSKGTATDDSDVDLLYEYDYSNGYE